MKSLLFVLPALVLAGVVGVEPAWAADPIGQVVELHGSASAVGSDGQSRNLELKSGIFLNDKIATAKDSSLQVVFNDDSIISQGENSELTVDQYVYTPGKKDDVNCAMKMTKGFFRVVTGKITTLNPDRLKVQTRMATIGVRGCEVGFALDEDREDIYIMWLPYGKSILVSKNEAEGHDASGLRSYRRIMNIFDEGTAVTILPDGGLEERQFGPQEARQFHGQFGGGMTGEGSRGDSRRGAAPAPAPAPAGTGDNKVSQLEITDNITDGLAYTPPEPEPEEPQEEPPPEEPPPEEPRRRTPAPAPTPVYRPPASEAPPVEQTVPSSPPQTSGPTEAPPTSPTSPTSPTDPTSPSSPTPPPLPPLPSAIVTQGNGSDWVWGIYDDGSVDHGGTSISDLNFQQLVVGATLYDLSGVGKSGAYITHASGNQVVMGPCSISLQVGQEVSPTWNGSFNMTTAPDGNPSEHSMAFNASGQILAGGQLEGSWSGYTLTVNGSMLDGSTVDPSSTVGGKLVGPGTGTTPITGVEGACIFVHNDGTRADVVYGANVSATAR